MYGIPNDEHDLNKSKDHGNLSTRPNIALLVYCFIGRVNKIIYCS